MAKKRLDANTRQAVKDGKTIMTSWGIPRKVADRFFDRLMTNIAFDSSLRDEKDAMYLDRIYTAIGMAIHEKFPKWSGEGIMKFMKVFDKQVNKILSGDQDSWEKMMDQLFQETGVLFHAHNPSGERIAYEYRDPEGEVE